jgi:hypothetical protein
MFVLSKVRSRFGIKCIVANKEFPTSFVSNRDTFRFQNTVGVSISKSKSLDIAELTNSAKSSIPRQFFVYSIPNKEHGRDFMLIEQVGARKECTFEYTFERR